jgi:hypothetical protein
MYTTSLLLAGQALNITVCSFADQLDMGILACPDLCPSPQRIAVYAGEEVAVLEEALDLKPPARAHRPAARRPARTQGCEEGAQGRRDDRRAQDRLRQARPQAA